MKLNVEVQNIEKAIEKINRLNDLLTEVQELKDELSTLDIEFVTEEVFPNVKQEDF